MKIQTTRHSQFALLLLSLLMVSSAVARESSRFPAEIQFSDAGEVHRLALTGEDERVFLVFSVYEIAHYAATGAEATMGFESVVEDGPVKAIAIRFSMSLSHEQVHREFDKSLRRNAHPEWLKAAAPTIDAFMAAIDRGVAEGDQLVFYWLAGGRVFVEFNGQRAFAATDTAFAKLVWSIWFGEDPVCDADELLAGVAGEAQ